MGGPPGMGKFAAHAYATARPSSPANNASQALLALLQHLPA